MKHILKRITLLAAALLILAVPALADVGAMGSSGVVQGQQSEKNECLLASINCPNEVDSIQQRIDKIKGEISKGSDVYTNDELRELNIKLDDANRMLEYESEGA